MDRPTTSGVWIIGMADMLKSVGIDAAPLLEEAGVAADTLADPQARFDTDTMSRLWTVITQRSGDDAIALRLSRSPRPATLDLLTYTMMTAPHMLGALERLQKFIRVISDASIYALEPDARGYWLRLKVRSKMLEVPRQRFEYNLITVLNVCRWISSAQFDPLALELTSPAPANLEPYIEAFSCPLYFDAEVCGLLIADKDLRQPLPAANPMLAELHERYAGEFLARMDKNRISHKVRDMIVRSLPDGDPPRSAAAAMLCMSERTLQRRLQEEGTSFQQLLDDIRRELAGEYLGLGEMAMGQIAYMLGFADQSILSRACQRWFAMSPRQYRQKLSEQGPGSRMASGKLPL